MLILLLSQERSLFKYNYYKIVYFITMNIKEEIRVFLLQLCRELSICDPLYKLDYFLAKEYYEVDNFIREVFLAEGINTDIELSLFRKVKRIFIGKFGSSEVYNIK